MRKRVTFLVTLLERVAAGNLDPDAALSQWGSVDDDYAVDKILGVAWHELSHFANDKDWRAKDPEYERQRARALADYASQIRAKWNLDG